MYTILSAFVVWLVVVIIRCSMNKRREGETKVFGVMSGWAIMAFLVVWFITSAIGGSAPQVPFIQSSAPLEAVGSRDSTSGWFVVAVGEMSTTPTYRAMVGNSDGSFSPKTFTADGNIHIVEDRSLKGMGRWDVRCQVADPNWSAYGWMLPGDPSNCVDVFVVPSGSVKHTFQLQ